MEKITIHEHDRKKRGFSVEVLSTVWNVLCVMIINTYDTVRFLSKLSILPLKKLYLWIKGKLQYTAFGFRLRDLNEKFYRFNGFVPFCLFVAAAVYSLVLLLFQIGNADGLSTYVENVLFNTTIGSFLGFIGEGLNFTPATVVSIAFSGAMLSACMGDEKPEGFVGYLMRILCHIVFFVAFAHLAVLLSGIFRVVGDWGFDTFVSLYNAETSNFFTTFGKILLLVILAYPVLTLLLLAVKEYAECIGLGLAFMLLVLLVTLLFQVVLKMPFVTESMLFQVVFLLTIFFADLFRPYIEKWSGKLFSRYSFYPEGWIDDFGE